MTGFCDFAQNDGTAFSILVADDERANRLTAEKDYPAKKAITGQWPTWVNPDLISAYQTIGINQPWLHQIQGANAIHHGFTTALATGTGTGKSLSFWLPALSSAMDDAEPSTVLYLSPTKALAADQLVALNKVLAALPKEARKPVIATCDGDTPSEQRRFIVDYANIVLTNPDFLHYSMLPGHKRWTRFFKNLRIVIIDEGHHYRGVFGSHVAQILRRLTRIVNHYRGQTPVFVIASATSADPIAAAARFIGVTSDAVTAITEDTAPQGTRKIALWQPPELPTPLPTPAPSSSPGVSTGSTAGNLPPTAAVDPWMMNPFDLPDPMSDPSELEQPAVITEPENEDGTAHIVEQPRKSAGAEASELLALLAAAGNRTLAFTRSRRSAETIASSARAQLEKPWKNLNSKQAETRKTRASRHRATPSVTPNQIAAYRGGYLPEERRELERQVRSGEVLGLATTNALELGVDISGLDAVLITGWPGTMMSLWQQAGRAGRAGADGLVVFIARDDPLDQYLVTHPDAVFDRPLEQVIFDPENRFVLAGHLCAAAAERPVQQSELASFGNPALVKNILDELTEANVLRRRDSGWYWTHHESAAALVDIRGAGGSPIRVVESRTGLMLGTVDSGAADYQVHTGAVYVHQGAMFVVDYLDLKERVAFVTRRKVDYGTWARQVMELAIDGENDAVGAVRETKHWGPIEWGLGPIEVTTQVVSYEKRRIPDLAVLGTEELQLPERTLNTIGVWITIPDEVLVGPDEVITGSNELLIGPGDAVPVPDDETARGGITRDQLPGALHAAEHAAIALLPLFATCDRWDLGGLSTELHADTGAATIFVYDALAGGAGFAARGYEVAEQWLTATRDLITNCKCETGCPACIQSPKCGNYNSPLEKAAAIKLLDLILSFAPSNTESIPTP